MSADPMSADPMSADPMIADPISPDPAGTVAAGAEQDGAPLQHVAVVGTGVIGAAWVSVFLAKGLRVTATDPGDGAQDRLHAAVAAHWPTMRLLGAAPEPDLDLLAFTADVAAAVVDVDLVQENGPEVLAVKHELFALLDEAAPSHALLASSSSGLLPADLQVAARRHPGRVIVAHPFNPVHVVPLVEVVPGPHTTPEQVRQAMEAYAWLGKKPVHVRRSVPGHIANRLQAALWREAYHLVESGVATVEDVDTAIAYGPGLRWAVLGPLVNQHLSGGSAGLAHVLAHLGPPMVEWWKDMRTPELTPQLVQTLVDGVDAELSGHDLDELAAARDRLILGLLAAKADEPALP